MPRKAKETDRGAIKRGRGKPRKYSCVEELQKKIDTFFRQRDGDNKPYTVTGLALACGMTRQGLCDYEGRGGDLADAIKTAKQRVEDHYESRLSSSTPTGAIFALKNFGWRDTHEISGNFTLSNFLKSLAGSDLGGDDGNK